MADMRVVESGNGRVWVENGAGDRFGFEFPTRSVGMTEMMGEPGWTAGAPPDGAAGLIDAALKVAAEFARQQDWVD